MVSYGEREGANLRGFPDEFDSAAVGCESRPKLREAYQARSG